MQANAKRWDPILKTQQFRAKTMHFLRYTAQVPQGQLVLWTCYARIWSLLMGDIEGQWSIRKAWGNGVIMMLKRGRNCNGVIYARWNQERLEWHSCAWVLITMEVMKHVPKTMMVEVCLLWNRWRLWIFATAENRQWRLVSIDTS